MKFRQCFRRPKKLKELGKEKELDRQQQGQEGPFLTGCLAEDVKYLKQRLGESGDVIFREYTLDLSEPIPVMVVFVDGLVSKEVINEFILQSLTFKGELKTEWAKDRSQLLRHIKDRVLNINEVSMVSSFPELFTMILSGETALLIEGHDEALICNTRGWEHRGIAEPQIEAVIRGPRVGFNEILRSNTAQIRRWIRDPHLTIKTMQIGKRSKTDVALVYLETVANPKIVQAVERRLKQIEIDGVVESSFLQDMIEDKPFSLFPTVQSTERADRVVASILEGRVAVLSDNTPFVLLTPVTFWQLYHSAEDYYHRWPMAFLLRTVRYLSFLFSLYLPSVYIALSLYNPELIPFNLAVKIAATREGVPFPVFLEALLMEIAIEIIREASARLPGPLGQTIGIVGGFILGDAAVRAGLISPITTIVVALTALSSFTAPSFEVAVTMRLLRFPLMFFALVGGLYGIAIATILLLIHMSGIQSFGVPYLAPVVPFSLEDFKDTFFTVPRWAMINRPFIFKAIDRKRRGTKTNRWWQEIYKPPQLEGDEEEE
ncbi:MAG TPA: spore germination protein [Bacillota bacterium]